MYNNHFAVHQKLTQGCQSTTLQFKKKSERILNSRFLGILWAGRRASTLPEGSSFPLPGGCKDLLEADAS